MLRAAVVLAIAGSVVAASAPPAEAKRARSSERAHAGKAGKAGKAKHEKHRKHERHGSKSRSSKSRGSDRGSKRRGNNMPAGFVWPPDARMKAAGAACTAELDQLGVVWTPAPALGKVTTPIYVPGMRLGGIDYQSYYRPAPFTFDCELAKTLETLGPDLYALGVRTVKFGSIYRNTNVRVGGVTKPFLSRHALGFAMDIVSFTDDTGREAVVKADYKQGDPLLLAIEDHVNHAGLFRTVLTPKNDPISHSDHFHIEVAVDFTKAP